MVAGKPMKYGGGIVAFLAEPQWRNIPLGSRVVPIDRLALNSKSQSQASCLCIGSITLRIPGTFSNSGIGVWAAKLPCRPQLQRLPGGLKAGLLLGECINMFLAFRV